MTTSPVPLRFKAAQHSLTIMFVDVAGFSLAAEGQTPERIFKTLRESIFRMRATVRAHGGVVDKVLGDGLLCHFGYSFETYAPVPDHAARALRCAVDLQRASLAECLRAADAHEPILPIRIGLNTADVYIGDLGDQTPELTVIGDGVNYAKRVEDSCDVFMVMMGESTRAAVAGADGEFGTLLKRGISIKHHDRLFDVYELDPFHDRPELLAKARRLHQQYRGVFRREKRRTFKQDAPFDIQSDYGDCTILDVSPGGFQVRLTRYLARGVQVKLSIAGKKPDRMAQYLNMIGLTTLNCIVKWGRAEGDGYLHGLQITNLNQEQRDVVYAMLLRYCAEDGSVAV